MEKESVINQKVREFSKQTDIIQTIIIFLTAFLVPTFLGNLITNVFGKTSIIASNSQLIIGSIVNSVLILTALNLTGKLKILGIVTMPSISTILSGYVFKNASPYMAYMIPAIWVGNFLLIYSYKLLVINKNKNYILTSIIGITLKVVVIFSSFSILKLFGVFPDKLVSNLQVAMSYTQLMTATIGAALTYIIYILEKKDRS